jgi:hypothetical protein
MIVTAGPMYFYDPRRFQLVEVHGFSMIIIELQCLTM